MTQRFFAPLLVSLAFFCCATPTHHPPAHPAKPLHHVFLVHGLAGSRSDFGAMPQALEHNLNSEDAPFVVVTHAFEYDTASNEKGTGLFSRQLATFVEQQLQRSGGLGEHDKLSFVCHSQGGLVTYRYLIGTALSEPGFFAKHASHFDAYITLATPFWGAKSATFARPLARFTNPVVDVLPGTRQLADMSFGSDLIWSLRSATIELVKNGAQLPVRPLNLGGALKVAAPLAPFSAGSDAFEDDTAVVLPSSRLDFIYYVSDGERYQSHAVTPASAFSQTRLSPWTVVDAIHLSPTPELPPYGIAQVRQACVRNPSCDHPSFSYVLSHLRGQTRALDRTQMAQMTAFLLDVNVRLPPGHKLSPNDVELRFMEQEDGVEIGRPLEPYSQNADGVAHDVNMVRRTFTGVAHTTFHEPPNAQGNLFDDAIVRFSIHAPGFLPRVIEAKIRPTWSTFVDVHLVSAPVEPEH